MKFITLLATICLSFTTLFAQADKNTEQEQKTDKLVILWSSNDINLAERMVLMYSHYSKLSGWWKDVTIIIWGPSAELVTNNQEIQKKITKMMKDGIKFQACKVCSDLYKCSEDLVKLGVEVKYMGKPFTEYLIADAKVLTF